MTPRKKAKTSCWKVLPLHVPFKQIIVGLPPDLSKRIWNFVIFESLDLKQLINSTGRNSQFDDIIESVLKPSTFICRQVEQPYNEKNYDDLGDYISEDDSDHQHTEQINDIEFEIPGLEGNLKSKEDEFKRLVMFIKSRKFSLNEFSIKGISSDSLRFKQLDSSWLNMFADSFTHVQLCAEPSFLCCVPSNEWKHNVSVLKIYRSLFGNSLTSVTKLSHFPNLQVLRVSFTITQPNSYKDVLLFINGLLLAKPNIKVLKLIMVIEGFNLQNSKSFQLVSSLLLYKYRQFKIEVEISYTCETITSNNIDLWLSILNPIKILITKLSVRIDSSSSKFDLGWVQNLSNLKTLKISFETQVNANNPIISISNTTLGKLFLRNLQNMAVDTSEIPHLKEIWFEDSDPLPTLSMISLPLELVHTSNPSSTNFEYCIPYPIKNLHISRKDGRAGVLDMIFPRCSINAVVLNCQLLYTKNRILGYLPWSLNRFTIRGDGKTFIWKAVPPPRLLLSYSKPVKWYQIEVGSNRAVICIDFENSAGSSGFDPAMQAFNYCLLDLEHQNDKLYLGNFNDFIETMKVIDIELYQEDYLGIVDVAEISFDELKACTVVFSPTAIKRVNLKCSGSIPITLQKLSFRKLDVDLQLDISHEFKRELAYSGFSYKQVIGNELNFLK